MKLVRRTNKAGKLYNAIISETPKGDVYDFDSVKIRLAIAIADPDKVCDLLYKFNLDFPAELLRSTQPWEITI